MGVLSLCSREFIDLRERHAWASEFETWHCCPKGETPGHAAAFEAPSEHYVFSDDTMSDPTHTEYPPGYFHGTFADSPWRANPTRPTRATRTTSRTPSWVMGMVYMDLIHRLRDP